MATTTDEQLALLKKRIATLEDQEQIEHLHHRIWVLENALLFLLKDDPDTAISREDHEGWVFNSRAKGTEMGAPRHRAQASASARRGGCAVIKGRSRIKREKK